MPLHSSAQRIVLCIRVDMKKANYQMLLVFGFVWRFVSAEEAGKKSYALITGESTNYHMLSVDIFVMHTLTTQEARKHPLLSTDG